MGYSRDALSRGGNPQVIENNAGLDNFGVNDFVVDIEPIAARLHYSSVAQKRKMLGDIGLGNAENLHQVLHAPLLIFYVVEYL